MEGIPHKFLITVTNPGKEPLAIHTEDCYKIFSDLEPDTEYNISVSTVLNDQCSVPVYITIQTGERLYCMLFFVKHIVRNTTGNFSLYIYKLCKLFILKIYFRLYIQRNLYVPGAIKLLRKVLLSMISEPSRERKRKKCVSQ